MDGVDARIGGIPHAIIFIRILISVQSLSVMMIEQMLGIDQNQVQMYVGIIVIIVAEFSYD
jgi:hypothetical protein